MRIALVHNLPPGGARRAAFELVRHTAGLHRYDVYRVDMGMADPFADDAQRRRQDPGKFAREVFDYALPGRVQPHQRSSQGRRALLARHLVSLYRRMASDIDSRGYDLVFAHHDQVLQAPPVLAYLRTPSVYYLQEPRRKSFEYSLAARRAPAHGLVPRGVRLAAAAFDMWLRELDIRSTRAASQLVTNSYHSLEFAFRAYGRYPAVSHLGVDARTFCPAGPQTVGERRGVLAVGALDLSKAHDVLIEAAAQIPAPTRPPITIVFERERPGFRDHLLALARRRQVQLELLRGIDDEQLAARYRAAAATVCAAQVEPFGLSAIESLACGTPVVALCEGGYREVVVDGRNGFLVDRQPHQLAQAVERVLARPERWPRDQLRSTVIPHFSWEGAGARIDAIFRRVRAGTASHRTGELPDLEVAG